MNFFIFILIFLVSYLMYTEKYLFWIIYIEDVSNAYIIVHAQTSMARESCFNNYFLAIINIQLFKFNRRFEND